MATGFQDRFARTANWLEGRPVHVVAFLSAVYFLFTGYLAYRKLIWDDEFFSLYISYAGYAGIWEALSTGADQHPPSFYWITYSVLKVFGFSHIGLRSPAMVGFWLLQLCLFLVVSRKWSNLLGYLAFLIPATTATYWWAYDARGYGLLLGFAGAAFLFWELAVDNVKRRVTVPMFAFCLAMAFGSHYYGILIVGPFALGTAILILQRQRLDIPLIAAHFSPLIPIIAFFPIIQKARGYSDHFWAQPLFKTVENTVDTVFNSIGLSLLAVCVALFVYGMTHSRASRQIDIDQPKQDPAIWAKLATLVGFAVLPLAGYLLGKFVTNAYSVRYAITSIVGITVIFTGVAGMYAGKSRSTLLSMVIIVFLGFFVNAPRLITEIEKVHTDLARSQDLILKYVERGRPMAMAEVTVFHRLQFYGSQEVKSRIFYLSNPQASIDWIGHDTIDRGLLDLAKWFHGGTVPYYDFLREHKTFYVYGYIGDWTWLTYQLVHDGFQLTVLERDGQRLVIRADRRIPIAE